MSIRMEGLISDRKEKTYPHLSPGRLQDFENIGATPEQIERADQGAKKEIDGRLTTYTLEENEWVVQDDRPRLRLAVIGTSGSGKSATGNTLLQEKTFCESTSAISQATGVKIAQSHFDPLLTVIDTPGSWDLPSAKIATGKDHIGLYVLVINLASPRFGREDLKRIQSLKDYNEIMKSKRCIVLLTHASDALQGKSLYEYVQEIKGDPLYDLIMMDMKGQRVMAINNNCGTKYEADKQHEMIVNVLQRTYKEANFNKETFWNCVDKKVWFFILSALSLTVMVIFLSVWFTHVPAALMTTTMEPNMTTGTTKPLTTTNTKEAGTMHYSGTGTSGTHSQETGTTMTGTGDTKTDTTGTGTTGTHSPGTGTSGTRSQKTVTTMTGTGDTKTDTTGTGTTGTHSPGTGTSGTRSQNTVTTTTGTGDSTTDKRTETTSAETAATQTRAVGTDTSQVPPNRKVKSGG